MMKTRCVLIVGSILIAILLGCNKNQGLDKEPIVTEKSPVVLASQATFEWSVDWVGKFISVVEMSENADMSHSTTYGLEFESENHNFNVTATDLKGGTRYYYCYLVWSRGYVDDKFKTEVKSFVTDSDKATVRTVEVTDITQTTATVIGEVVAENGSKVKERGVCWGTRENPTFSGAHANSGNGTGTYSITLSDLEMGKTYYTRAYAINEEGVSYGEELSFNTNSGMGTVVTTSDVADIEWRTATGGGEVTSDGGAPVTERGICWGYSPNPDITGNHISSGVGTGSFSAEMTGLVAGTTYFVRAYAKHDSEVSYGNGVGFKTKDPVLATVNTNDVIDITYTTAKCGGEVTVDGGTELVEWGVCWNTSPSPTITGTHAVGSNDPSNYTAEITGLTAGTVYYVRAYVKNSIGVAYGEEKSFTSKPVTKPTVVTSSGVGVQQISAMCSGVVADDGGIPLIEYGVYFGISPNPVVTGAKIVASSIDGARFTCLIENLNAETTYYICAYATNSQGTGYGADEHFKTPPVGALGAPFSVSADSRVYFSQGNLQFRASNGTWRLAEHQYDCVGNGNSAISSNYSGWIDLFGWGTSGWNSGAVCYQPWSTNIITLNYYPGGDNTVAMTGEYANADWGVYNAISNGGNQTGLWRTLTIAEWRYLCETRETTSGIRYAKAVVNGVSGFVLLPDDWNDIYYTLNNTNYDVAQYASNTISVTQWTVLEQYGAVFLPAAGLRMTTDVTDVGNMGHYWSATPNTNEAAYFFFDEEHVLPYCRHSRAYGQSVRLVRSYQ